MFQLSAVLVLAGLATSTYAVPTATSTCSGFTAPTPVPPTPKQIIIDTDLLSFTDDDVTSQYSLPGIDAINTWYCNPNINLAQISDLTTAIREPTVKNDDKEYITGLGKFPQNFDRQKVQDPVQFYTDVLTTAKDNSITILAIGFLTNLNNFYNSQGGPTLIKAKVKELIIQGGSFDTDHPEKSHSAGFNLEYDFPSAREVITKWPSPITFFPGHTADGVEVGHSALNASSESPIRYVYENVNYTAKYNFGSADPLAAYYAIFGTSDLFTYGNDGKGRLQFVKNESSSVIPTEYEAATIWNYSLPSPEPTKQNFLLFQKSVNVSTVGKKLDSIISCYAQKPTCQTSVGH